MPWRLKQWPLRRPHLTLFISITLFALIASCMKKEDFKTCSQSGFCRRNRAYADMATDTPGFQSPYALVKDTIRLDDDSHVYADIINTENDVLFTLDLHILEDNTSRVRINEKQPIKPRYDDHVQHTLVNGVHSAHAKSITSDDQGVVTVALDDQRKIVLHPHPVRLDFFVDNAPVISLNDRGLFRFEHLRTKETHKPKMIEQKKDNGEIEQVEAPWESGLWEETFKSWTDPKPNGPESISMDITFHDFAHVYGIPEHASSLSLKETRGGDNAYTDPYRLYNTDVFEYALDSPTSLYGAVPFMIAHRAGASCGVFWMNPSETWIDIVKKKSESRSSMQKILNLGKTSAAGTTTQTHWISEAGVLDLFVFLGPSVKDVMRQYTQLTGTAMLPQEFSLGYHQCRWNYINQKDVLEVDSQFDAHEMPYDVIWLDIEYTDDRKYFTWEDSKFPEPIKMEQVLDSKGRELVVIIDPHIKRADGYRICDEAKKDNLFVKQPSGSDYEAWCWPGQSSWVDFFKPEARQWWKEQFRFDKFIGTQENVHLWNDMSEPSVFNGPEITMQKEMIHHGNWEHRVLHNMYALLSHAATADGVRERTQTQKRPFVLTRGFYAGVQRYGAVWTGDNMADWESLYYSNPMSLTNGLGGVAFTGADIPGFFNNPPVDLLVRWYQAGVFQPFFRGHAHIDTKRREPYLVPEPYRSMTLASLRERYALLPYWYTLFYETSNNGTPMMRPMFMEYPEDEALFATEDQFMMGDGIMVKPVTQEGATETNVYFPGDQPWYDMQTHETIKKSGYHTVQAPLEKIPAYYRAGSIVPRRERVRRSSRSMKLDPFTLIIPLTKEGSAQGLLYHDDGESYDYQDGSYIYTLFKYENGSLTSKNMHKNPDKAAAQHYAKSMSQLRLERLVILGVTKQPVHVTQGTRELSFDYEPSKNKLVVKNPGVSISDYDWKIDIE